MSHSVHSRNSEIERWRTNEQPGTGGRAAHPNGIAVLSMIASGKALQRIDRPPCPESAKSQFHNAVVAVA
jgi:hypothetical protein